MPNNYKKMTPEQMENWRKYQSEYFRKNCKSYNIKLFYNKDQDVIDYINANGPITDLIRKLVRDKLQK